MYIGKVTFKALRSPGTAMWTQRKQTSNARSML